MAKVTTTYGKAQKQTDVIAKYLGVKATARSGATQNGGKGDMVDALSLFECKTQMSEKESFTIKREWLSKIKKEQFEDRKDHSFLVFDFGRASIDETFVVMTLRDFDTMYDIYKKEVSDNE